MLEGLTPPKKIPACKVRAVMTALDDKDKQSLQAALDNAEWGHQSLAIELNKRGIFISEHPIRKHRIGRCSCNA